MRLDQVQVGTSGWQYRDWRNVLYPSEVPQRLWLECYSEQFPVVEVDATFYRLPERSVFENWRHRTPEAFRFAIKASRFLTHTKRLRDPQEPVGRLLDRARCLSDKLAVILLQLPPTMTADPELLDQTLACFGDVPVAVEPRHDSWWCPEVAEVLRNHRVATVWADRRSALLGPLWQTSDIGYVRLHEGRSTPWPHYGRTALRSWESRLAEAAPNWEQAFLFFNNDPGSAAVRNARYLTKRLARNDS